MSNTTARYLRLTLTNANRDPDWRPPVLSTRARHLLEVLSSYANERGQAWPAVDVLAERMGVHEDTVGRARAELVAAGLIAVDIGGGRGATNRYRFPVESPLTVVTDDANPRADAGVSSTQPPRPRGGSDIHNPRVGAAETPAPTRGEEPMEEPRVTSRDVTRYAAPQPGFGGWSSHRRARR